jgi:LEA14-like dessication related protein
MIEKQSSSHTSKKMMVFTIFVVLFFLLNIVLLGFIFVDIKVVSSPEIVLELELLDINADELLMMTTLSIENTNQFDFIIKDLQISTKTETNHQINIIQIDGGTITSHSNETFSQTTPVMFNDDIPSMLTTDITGTIGVNIFGLITKTIPLQMTMITHLGDSIDSIDLPEISMTADFYEISNDGVGFLVDLDIDNPNTFDFDLKDISIQLKTEAGEIIKDILIKGTFIQGQQTYSLQLDESLPLTTLNAEKIIASIDTSIGIHLAGIKKYMDVSTQAEIGIPHLHDIFSGDAPTVAFIDGDMKLVRGGFFTWGFKSIMSLEITNPNPLDLYADNVSFLVYGDYKGTHILIANVTVTQVTIQKENITIVPTELYIPLKTILYATQGLIPKMPDGLIVVVEANVTLPGLNDYLWIGVGGYQDLKIIT